MTSRFRIDRVLADRPFAEVGDPAPAVPDDRRDPAGGTPRRRSPPGVPRRAFPAGRSAPTGREPRRTSTTTTVHPADEDAELTVRRSPAAPFGDAAR
ncbi:hypothetical protein ACIQF6_29595 [Kitasatospora sp. NPDC092948]|uniref:hypothetical protein n=1 Tax=Kitasatospora sp. NPDC092948 TaxID=3364088 RepID=UPI0038021263